MSRNNAIEVLHNSARDRAKFAIRPKNPINKGSKPCTKPPRDYVFVQKGYRPLVLKTFPNPMYTGERSIDEDVLALSNTSGEPVTLNTQTYRDIVLPNIRRIGNMMD